MISSVTGKPFEWDEAAGSAPAGSGREAPKVLPDRVSEEAPEPCADESNDARLTGDVPPHWGR